MKLKKRQIKKAARLIAGSLLYDFNRGQNVDELGCSQEDWLAICAEGRKIAERLLEGSPALNWAGAVIALVQQQEKEKK